MASTPKSAVSFTLSNDPYNTLHYSTDHRCKKRSEKNKNVKKREKPNKNKNRLRTLDKKRSSPIRNT